MSFVIEEDLFEWLYLTLHQTPLGLSEHDLLKRLMGEDQDSIWSDAFKNSHALFRAHFVLFHVLYRLRNRLWEEKRGNLEINPVKLHLYPYKEGEEALNTYDPLMDYYLDFANLENTSSREVDEMLASFYVKLHSKDKRQQALQVLGLNDPVDDGTIKKHYRHLAMEHHPDRGGETERLQEIHAAMRILIH